jgi:CheY-like chemotaxis protein
MNILPNDPDPSPADGSDFQNVIDSFPDLVQAEAEQKEQALPLEPTPVAEEVRTAVAAYRPVLEKKGLFLNIEMPGATCVRAPLNAEAFQRILVNLLDNAVKFTEEGGIGIKVKEEAHAVSIAVADTGSGIGDAFREQLFEDFTQEAPDTEGSGLGLAIAKRLTQQMDGTIEVTSIESQGTVFTVSFPRVAPPEPQPKTNGHAARADGAKEASQPRLLLVEDNRNTRALARHVLRSDYDVTCVASAEDALAEAQDAAAAETPAFEVFLLDINLGEGEDGVDLLQRLRERPAYDDVPAIAFTAYAMEGDEERLRAAGFDGYLPKPFSKEELLEEVKKTRASAAE